MVTTKEYIDQLKMDKQVLVNNLVAKGVDATLDETFTSLVPKVSKIESGGGKYAPRKISFSSYEGTELDYELANLDTRNVTSMASIFSNCRSLTEVDLSNFNTSNVTSVASMFSSCSSLIEVDLSSFDFGNVTTMNSMFNTCSNLKKITFGMANTSNVTNMANLFSSCVDLINVDVNYFNTSKVTTMRQMFNGCGFDQIDVSSFDTGNVTDMSYMFNGCTKLTSLDVSNFNTSKTTAQTQMFANSNLTKLIINNPSVFKMTSTNMFSSTPIASGTGYVYVPDELKTQYQQATNWSNFASQIKGLSELEV